MAININDAEYDLPRNWIKRKRQKNESWEYIEDITDSIPDFFERRIEEDDWPSNSKDIWFELISKLKNVEEKAIEIREAAERGTLYGTNQINDLKLSDDEFSCWNLYRARLAEKKYSSTDIERIQQECLNVLHYMNANTANTDPVKGLVLGYVQSGKTANMEGLISMAADCGWNVFIILSGTINSLRDQTQKRMYNDLKNDKCRYYWHTFNHLSPSDKEADPTKLKLDTDSPMKYLSVCLKNKKRLTDLLKWLNMDEKKKGQMRILLIDDEADQASINTADLEKKKRTAINNLIVNIVECIKPDGLPGAHYGAMNYVSYTATPYANFLSEGTPESLYPRDFVTMLSTSNLYCGPTLLYGLSSKDLDPLGIINTYENTEEAIYDIHEEKTTELPIGLKKAIGWFICCIAIRRMDKKKLPVSMLVHTSAITDYHKSVANAIYKYLTSSQDAVFQMCQEVYKEQTAVFTKDMFFKKWKQHCPTGYGRKEAEVTDYPSFSLIAEEVRNIIGIVPTHIVLDDEHFTYSKGINLCIDNSKYDILADLDDEEETYMPRLIYPDPEKPGEYPDFTPAFLVVGGNTMSRGLTLEGLVSTYFARPVAQGDTLMQMGRWFGYRVGYELLPRMWMSRDSFDSFCTLIDVDEALRDFIRDNYKVISPRELPPKIKQFPKNTYIKEITVASKRRGAYEVDFNFEGVNTETTNFDLDPIILQDNMTYAREFIKSLGNGFEESKMFNNILVWHGVPGTRVFEDFLNKLKFSKRQKNFNEINEMKRWIQSKGTFEWNIVLPLSRECDGVWCQVGNHPVYLVERKARHFDNKLLQIGALSSVSHRYADVDPTKFYSEEGKTLSELKKSEGSRWREIRKCCGCHTTPTLVIYCVSKEYHDEGNVTTYSGTDIIGMSVVMPGVTPSDERARFLQIPPSITKGE